MESMGRTGSSCSSPSEDEGVSARTFSCVELPAAGFSARSLSCATPAEDIAPTCWARIGSCAGPIPDAGDVARAEEPALPVVCKKRSRSDLLAESAGAEENIANELGVGGEDNNLSTTDEDTTNHLSPRCLFPEPAGLEDGELPPDHPDAIYDTTDLIGRHAGHIFTNAEADNNPSQIY